MDPASLKSERSAKLLMTKLDKRYDAAIGAKNEVGYRAREGGWSQEMFAEEAEYKKAMAAIIVEMEALKAACDKRGWYVPGKWLRYWGSTHCALVAANID